MIKVAVIKNQVQTHGGLFETQQEVDAWIEDNKKAFGQIAEWVTEAEASIGGQKIPKDAQSRVRGLDDMGSEVIEYFIPCDYVIEQSDYIDPQPAKEAAKVARLNELKLIDLSKITTIAGLKAVVQLLIDDRLGK